MDSMTPTQLIYQSAMKSPVVNLAMGKRVKYEPASTADVNDEQCWLCGGKTGGKGQPVKTIIKPTFTDIDRAQINNSNSVCPGCCFCLSYRELRNYSIVVADGMIAHPTRPELKCLLLNPPEPPFLFCIAESGQKWLHFKSEIAYSQNNYPVQMEDTMIYVNVDELKKILSIIEELYTVFSKEEIKTGRYNQNRIKQIGLSRFEELENRIIQYRTWRMFALALFVAQKKEAN